MKDRKYNVVVLDVSCFEGMAGPKRVRNLIDPLIKKKLIKVSNLIFHSANEKPRLKEGIENSINYKVIGFKLSNFFYLCTFFLNGMSFLKKNKLINYTNIIYNYGGPNIKNITFIIYAKLIGYKIICDFTEDNRYEPIVGHLNYLKNKSSLFLLKYISYFADSLIGISDHLYLRLLHFSKGKVPVTLVPICVNFDYFPYSHKEFDNSSLKIFYGGSFNEKDGLEYLILAFDKVCEKHNNIELILSGYATEFDLDRVKAVINKTEFSDKIIYKGFLSTSEYFSLLNQCDIFCMTRVNSSYANAGFPFKLGEFLATGKAIIATNVGDVSKYLFNNVNAILISPNSTVQLIEALLMLIEYPEKFKSLGVAGRKTAENYFDSEKVSMKLYAVLKSI